MMMLKTTNSGSMRKVNVGRLNFPERNVDASLLASLGYDAPMLDGGSVILDPQERVINEICTKEVSSVQISNSPNSVVDTTDT